MVKVDPRIDTNVAGYRVEAPLAHNGSYFEYLARDTAQGRVVVLRLPAPELAGNARFRERFLRESARATHLDHPNILPVLAAGESDGLLFMAMPRVEAVVLSNLLATEGRLDPERAVLIVAQVAEALDAARWSQSLVHGSLTPSEVLIPAATAGPSEHVLLRGFGMRQDLPAGAGSSDGAGAAATLGNLAPERLAGGPAAPRGDVYALGCLLRACLAGGPAAEQGSTESLGNTPGPTAGGRADVREALGRVIVRATATLPEERYSTCCELAAAAQAALAPAPAPAEAGIVPMAPPLREKAEPRGGIAPPEQLPRAPATGAGPPAPPAHTPSRARWATRRKLVVVVGIVALLAGVLGTAVGLRDQGDARSTAAPAPADPSRATLTLSSEKAAPAEPPSAAPAEPNLPAEALTGSFGDPPYRAILSLGPGSLVRLDDRTGETRAQVSIPSPFQLAADREAIWALSAEPIAMSTMLLARVDASSNSVTDVFNAWSRPLAPLGLVVVDGNALFSNEDGRTLLFSAGKSAGEPVEFATGSTGFGWPVTAAGSLWISRNPDLLRVDPRTGEVQARVQRVNHVVVAGPGFLWALGNEPRTGVVHIDTKTNATTPLGEPGFPWADFTSADGAVWVSSREDGTIVRLNASTGAQEGSPVRLGQGPFTIAGGERSVWAAISAEGVVARYDIATGRIERFDVGGVPIDVVRSGDSIWVAVAAPTREEYAASAEAVCGEATKNLSDILAALFTPGAFDIDDVRAFNVLAAHYSEVALTELRALPAPEADQAGLAKEYALREQEIRLMRQVVRARAAGDFARADELIDRRREATQQRGDFGILGAECPVALAA